MLLYLGIKFKNTSGIKDEKITVINRRTKVNTEVIQCENAPFTLYYKRFLRGYKEDNRDFIARCVKDKHLNRSRVQSMGNYQ